MDAFFQSQRSAAMANLKSLSPAVKQHVRQVYWTVGTALISSALGVYVHMLLNIGGFLTSMAFIGTLLWFLSMPATKASESKRWNMLMTLAFLQGTCLGSLVEVVLFIDPSVVLVAFLGTVVVFGCLSAAALVAPRREYLYLGGFLGSGVSLLLSLSFFSMFFGGLQTVELYLGLMVFCGYVIYDTQLIVERAERGDRDYIRHSLDLVFDFVDIFYRLLIVLARKAAEKEERRERRKRS